MADPGDRLPPLRLGSGSTTPGLASRSASLEGPGARPIRPRNRSPRPGLPVRLARTRPCQARPTNSRPVEIEARTDSSSRDEIEQAIGRSLATLLAYPYGVGPMPASAAAAGEGRTTPHSAPDSPTRRRSTTGSMSPGSTLITSDRNSSPRTADHRPVASTAGVPEDILRAVREFGQRKVQGRLKSSRPRPNVGWVRALTGPTMSSSRGAAAIDTLTSRTRSIGSVKRDGDESRIGDDYMDRRRPTLPARPPRAARGELVPGLRAELSRASRACRISGSSPTASSTCPASGPRPSGSLELAPGAGFRKVWPEAYYAMTPDVEPRRREFYLGHNPRRRGPRFVARGGCFPRQGRQDPRSRVRDRRLAGVGEPCVWDVEIEGVGHRAPLAGRRSSAARRPGVVLPAWSPASWPIDLPYADASIRFAIVADSVRWSTLTTLARRLRRMGARAPAGRGRCWPGRPTVTALTVDPHVRLWGLGWLPRADGCRPTSAGGEAAPGPRPVSPSAKSEAHGGWPGSLASMPLRSSRRAIPRSLGDGRDRRWQQKMIAAYCDMPGGSPRSREAILRAFGPLWQLRGDPPGGRHEPSRSTRFDGAPLRLRAVRQRGRVRRDGDAGPSPRGPSGFADFEYGSAVAGWWLVVVRGGIRLDRLSRGGASTSNLIRPLDGAAPDRFAARLGGWSALAAVIGFAVGVGSVPRGYVVATAGPGPDPIGVGQLMSALAGFGTVRRAGDGPGNPFRALVLAGGVAWLVVGDRVDAWVGGGVGRGGGRGGLILTVLIWGSKLAPSMAGFARDFDAKPGRSWPREPRSHRRGIRGSPGWAFMWPILLDPGGVGLRRRSGPYAAARRVGVRLAGAGAGGPIGGRAPRDRSSVGFRDRTNCKNEIFRISKTSKWRCSSSPSRRRSD